MDKLYFFDLIRNLTNEQLEKFMEFLYNEAQEGVEHDEEHGYSSVPFHRWLEKDSSIRDSVIQEYNRITETY